MPVWINDKVKDVKIKNIGCGVYQIEFKHDKGKTLINFNGEYSLPFICAKNDFSAVANIG